MKQLSKKNINVRRLDKSVHFAVNNIGIDILEIERLRNITLGSPFYKKVFTAEELLYAQKKKDPYPSLAGIFAAKEAVKKALLTEKIALSDIIIRRRKNGAPYALVRKISKKINFHISISHSNNNAIACCIISGGE